MSLKRRRKALTPRQREIGGLVARGLQDKQIAMELGISEETVNYHLKVAFREYGFHSRVEFALFVSRNGNGLNPKG